MKEFKAIFLREIDRFAKFKILPLIAVVIPLLTGILYAVMFSQRVVNSLPVAVCDQDMTTTSRQVVTMLSSRQALQIKLQTNSVEEARKMLASKRVAIVVYIPKNFEADILNVSGTSVKAVVDGAFLSRASMAYKEVVTVLTALNIGVETKVLSSQGIPEAAAYQLAYPIVNNQHILFNPYTSYAYFLLPGLFPLILVVTTLFVTLFAVGSEFRYGTAGEWLSQAGGNIWVALIAKLLLYFIIMQILVVFFNTMIFRYLGIEVNLIETVLITLGAFLLVASYMSIGIAIITFFPSMRFSLSLGTLYGVAAFSFSGLTFPTVAMPTAIQVIGYLFPYYYYMELFIEQGMRNNPNFRLSIIDLGMFIVFMSITLLSVFKLKKNCTNPDTYGRL